MLCSVHETTVRAGEQSERCSEHQVRRLDSDMDHGRPRPDATHLCRARSLASVLVGDQWAADSGSVTKSMSRSTAPTSAGSRST